MYTTTHFLHQTQNHNNKEMKSYKHFVLVHGSCHGAWCWYKIVTLLKSAGHSVTALDLSASGVNAKRFDEVSSISDYVKPLVEFMASLPDDDKVFLVGHSFGGFSISLAMEAFPEKISAAVFVTAFMPDYLSPPGTIFLELTKYTDMESKMDNQYSYNLGPENLPTYICFGPQYLATKMYERCQSEDVELAKMLVRLSGFFVEDLAKNSLLTAEKFGTVNRVFVVCGGDQILTEEYQRWMINNNEPKEVKLISQSDHIPMLSTPKELFLCLVEISQNYV